jgi:hypothetical protein
MNRCLRTDAFEQPPRERGAAMPRDAFQRAAKPGAPEIPQAWDWKHGSDPGLHSWCPAAGYWAYEAYGLPCLPAGKAGNGWTHEIVPQILNQNAYRQISFLKELPGRYYLAPPVQPRTQRRSMWIPRNKVLQSLDAACAAVVQNLATVSHFVKPNYPKKGMGFPVPE